MVLSFAQNNKLITIDMGGNQLNHSTMKKIQQITERNRNLKKVILFSSFL